jgi:hypothetical protein
MNKHIELVKKWLDDPASVTQQELQGNNIQLMLAVYAADYAYAGDDVNAEYWVTRYDKIMKEQE